MTCFSEVRLIHVPSSWILSSLQWSFFHSAISIFQSKVKVPTTQPTGLSAVHELSLRWQSQHRFWEQEIHPINWTGVQYCLTYSWCHSLLCTIKVRLALFSSCFFIFSSSVRFLLAVLTPLKLPPWIKSWATSINTLPNNPQSDTTSELHASHLLNFNIPKQTMPLSQVSPLPRD